MTESYKWFWLVILLITVGFVYLLSPILSPFLVAALLAYMGNPLVNYLQGLMMPRTLAVLVALFCLGRCSFINITGNIVFFEMAQ